MIEDDIYDIPARELSDLDSVGSRLFRPLTALGSGHDASDAVSLMFRITEGD